jgi:hypothetical protein
MNNKKEIEIIEKRSYKLYETILKQAELEMDNRFNNEETILRHWKKVCKVKAIWIKFYDLKLNL